jgi:hypothetical protein
MKLKPAGQAKGLLFYLRLITRMVKGLWSIEWRKRERRKIF